MHNGLRRLPFLFSGLIVAVGISACGDSTTLPSINDGDSGTEPTNDETALCQQLLDGLSQGSFKDGIPAVSNPELVSVGDPGTDYLLGTDRVIGLEIDGDYVAIPHNILWWHEIMNFNDAGLAVTYCPLTGSSMVFDRGVSGGAEFGVSGLLFQNNLVMYDRAPSGVDETLWPQMLAGGRCGPAEGNRLTMVPALEIEWEDWVALHPDTRVVSDDTGFSRDYTEYPYGNYEIEDNSYTLFPQGVHDPRRPPKERVLGIPGESGEGLAVPFGALRSLGDLAVAHATVRSGLSRGRVVVFWDSEASAAMAYRPSAGTQDLTFEVRSGAFVDLETGSEWSLEGKALSGPLAGQSIAMISDAYVSFWFAFSTFYENLDLLLP